MNFNNVHFNNIRFNYVEMKTTYTKFEEKFSKFDNINPGDKVGFDASNNLYINKKGTFQSFVRWFQSQNREK